MIKTATQVTTQGKEKSFKHRRLMHGVKVATAKKCAKEKVGMAWILNR